MTSELILRLILTIGLSLGLDMMLVRLRRDPALKNLAPAALAGTLLDRFSSWFEGRQAAGARLVGKIKLPWRTENRQPESAPLVEASFSQPVTESAPGVAPGPGNESQAAQVGLVHVQINADVPPGTVVHITITTQADGQALVQQSQTPSARQSGPGRRFTWPVLRFNPAALLKVPPLQLANSLFLLTLALYLLTRLVGLSNYPIYFFGDEAVQTVSAAELLRHGLRGPSGIFLPTYFQNGAYFNLSLSVYLQVLPQMLFGNSIVVTRGTSVLVTLLAVFAVAKAMQRAFNANYWWAAGLLLAVIPAWFLHSRTAFETALFVSFYAGFLYFYLEYRLRDPRQATWAALLAGLAFYSYSPGQLVLAVTVMLLFLNDLKYHWQQRIHLSGALTLAVLMAVPYLRFRLTSTYSPLDHLRQLGSYWIEPLPLTEKLLRYFQTYLYGLSPGYWFASANTDLVRHHMRGYGNLPLWSLPLFATGLIVALRRFRETAYRVVLVAALAAPCGASLAEIGITRVLVFVIPASLLTAIGLEALLGWLEGRLASLTKRPFTQPLMLLLFLTLASLNLALLTDALRNGPTWYPDYGLYGMQYGAKQIYSETVLPIIKQDPDASFVITPSWANGAEQFLGFFIPAADQPRVMLGQIYDLLPRHPTLSEKVYFIVSPEEHEKLTHDPKIKEIVERLIIPYPNGQPGFYVLNLKLADNIDALLAAEQEAARRPVEEDIELNGIVLHAVHSPLGGGSLADLMDGDPHTLAKGAEANPLLLEYYYPAPIQATQLVLTTGSMSNFDVSIQLFPPGSDQSISYVKNFSGLPPDPTITLAFTNGPASFDHFLLTVKDNGQGQIAQVHIREISFK